MVWFIPLIMAAASAYQGAEAGKRAKSAEDKQRMLEEESMRFSQARFEEAQRRERPLFESLLAEVQEGPSFGYRQQKAEIEKGFREAETGLQRRLAATGMEGTGLAASQRQALQLAKPQALAQAWQQGRERRQQVAMQLLGRTGIEQATQNVLGGFQRRAATADQEMERYAGLAGQAYGAAGQALGEFGQYEYDPQAKSWLNMFKRRNDAPPPQEYPPYYGYGRR